MGQRHHGQTELPSRRLNILSFDYEYPPVGGGGGVFHEQISVEMAKRHRVTVVTSGFRGLKRHEIRDGVEIHRVPVLGRGDPSAASLVSLLAYPPAAWLAAARLMVRTKYDLIHSHFAVPTGPGSLPPAFLARLPHVLTIQGGDIYDPSKKLSPHRSSVLRRVVTTILRCSSAVVAASTNIRDNVYQYYGYRGRIELIPLGIKPPHRIPEASRADLGLPEGVFLGVTVGRLVRRKGLDLLIRALARPECSAIHLAVIGSGPEEGRLQSLAQDLHLGNRVRFLGRVDDDKKWQVLQAADVYFSASMHEGFGLVYLEAMTAGLPVITPDEGGQADFLEDGITGYLIPPGDLEALAQTMARAAVRRDGLRTMGASNRVRAADYRIDRVALRYERLFASILGRMGGPARATAPAS